LRRDAGGRTLPAWHAGSFIFSLCFEFKPSSFPAGHKEFFMTRSLFSDGVRAPRRAPAAGIHLPARRRPRVAPCGAPESLEQRTLLSVFTVTTAADAGPGSLRQAILDANAAPGADDIRFNIPGPGVHTVRPASPLPEVTDATRLDATTLPGYSGSPLIELDGSLAGPDADGITVRARGSAVLGLAINRFGRNGAVVSLPPPTQASHAPSLLALNYIGTDASGSAARPNGGAGVLVAGAGVNIGVGDTGRNVISGNAGPGVWVTQGAAAVAEAPRVFGNFIGTDATGTSALPNGKEGVRIEAQVAWLSGNVISGNAASGVWATGPSTVAYLNGNRIGTDASGTRALGNGSSPASPSRNGVIATGDAGLQISGDVISGNAGAGVFAVGGTLTLNDSKVGTDVTGLAALGNANWGVVAVNCRGVNLGGNVISGNGGDGVRLAGVMATAASPSVLTGNRIGLNVAGTGVLANRGNGVTLKGCLHVHLERVTFPGFDGPPTTSSPNLIGGNTGYGVWVDSSGEIPLPEENDADIVLDQNRIGAGNFVGEGGRTLYLAAGNGVGGVRVAGVGGVTVRRNVIGHNAGHGVTLGSTFNPGGGLRSSDNLVEANFIGATDANGSVADTGNGGNGVAVLNGSGNLIVDNTIAFNDRTGVIVVNGGGNLISRNSIFSNARFAIDLAPGAVEGPTPNDPLDADSGPNQLQNYPVLVHYGTNWPDTQTAANFVLNSRPNRRYRVELFADGRYVGETTVTTDAEGNASGIVRGTGSARTQNFAVFLSATATDLGTNDTSELSPRIGSFQTRVLAGYFFYNNSAYDGRDPSAGAADDAAIAPDKFPTPNVHYATPPNYTSYDKGINGIMFDMVGLPAGSHPVSAGDFGLQFWDTVRDASGHVRNRRTTPPPPSSITVRRGAGIDGSDRVTLIWPDGLLRNGWLGVSVRGGGGGWFGNLVGDAGGARYPNGIGNGSVFVVNALDLAATRARLGQAASLLSPYDYNRDGRIDALDLAAVRANQGALLALYITAP
jgi:parallel beta-helix repeat protein